MPSRTPLCYRIRDGVRRAIAAREAGWSDIPARVVESGHPDLFCRVDLVLLVSPKAVIDRDSRYIADVEYPTQVLRTEPPPVEVSPVYNPRVAAVHTPLARVLLI